MALRNENILVTMSADSACITLNRPERLNALNADMISTLTQAIEEVTEDSSIKSVVLTGEGRTFSVGLDLKDFSKSNSAESLRCMEDSSYLMEVFARCTKPIIGAINGPAITGGFELALACDFLYAAESASFSDTHAQVGLIPGWGLSQKLPRIIGIGRAREICFTGSPISAEKACEWGLVNKVVADGDLLESALEVSNKIALAMPEALFGVRAAINSGWELTLSEGLQLETNMFNAHTQSFDFSVLENRLNTLKKRAFKK
jgi:enoyl-CoA hydratase